MCILLILINKLRTNKFSLLTTTTSPTLSIHLVLYKRKYKQETGFYIIGNICLSSLHFFAQWSGRVPFWFSTHPAPKCLSCVFKPSHLQWNKFPKYLKNIKTPNKVPSFYEPIFFFSILLLFTFLDTRQARRYRTVV